MTLMIPEGNSTTVLKETINILGDYMHTVIDKLVASVEDQIMLVFNEHADKQRKVEVDAAIVRKHRWEEGHSIISPTASPTTSSVQPPAVAESTSSPDPQPPCKLKRKLNHVSPLSAHLFLTLDSLVTSLNAEKGAIHLHSENFLRCAAQFPPSRENADIPVTSTCLHSTVFATGVAVNTSMGTTADVESSQRKKEPTKRQKQILALPIPCKTGGKTRASIGVLTLWNRKNSMGQPCTFRHRDEVLVYDAVGIISNLIYRYPLSLFLQSASTVSSLVKLASSHQTTRLGGSSSELLSSVRNQDSEELLILRSPKDNIAREMVTGQKSTFFCETELRECVTYIHSLEQMWRNCLDENSALQGDVTYWKKRKEEKDTQLIAMEVSAKDISKQYIKVKNDLQRMKMQLATPLPDLHPDPVPPAASRPVSYQSRRQSDKMPALVPSTPLVRGNDAPKPVRKRVSMHF
eukprot:TRINITY_DN16232_c0_g1_i1.p1 TRINITY_DN16232_c0_g1~~TRINITY_DN16232_c0_g1_i1.p1  ORF type:complete len:531 (+),score=77.72 TRINITY_DN16232_c0_g1_i1:205-1593(+)